MCIIAPLTTLPGPSLGPPRVLPILPESSRSLQHKIVRNTAPLLPSICSLDKKAPTSSEKKVTTAPVSDHGVFFLQVLSQRLGVYHPVLVAQASRSSLSPPGPFKPNTLLLLVGKKNSDLLGEKVATAPASDHNLFFLSSSTRRNYIAPPLQSCQTSLACWEKLRTSLFLSSGENPTSTVTHS